MGTVFYLLHPVGNEDMKTSALIAYGTQVQLCYPSRRGPYRYGIPTHNESVDLSIRNKQRRLELVSGWVQA